MPKRRTVYGPKKKAKKSRPAPSAPRPVVPDDVQPPPAPVLSDIPFNLPRTTAEQVFGSLSPADIIRFVLSSTTSFNFTHNFLRVSATRVHLFHFPDQHCTKSIIIIETPNHLICVIEIVADPRRQRPPSNKVWGRNATATSGRVNAVEWICVSFEKPHDARMVAMELTKFVLNTFNTTNIEMRSNCDTRDNDMFWILKRVRNFSKMAFSCKTPKSMKLEELQYVMGTLSVDSMYFGFFLPNLKYTGPINNRILMISYASWLTGESLLDMNCEILIARGTQLGAADLNGFLNEWQTNMNKFGILEFIYFEQHDRFPIDPEELNLEKWPPRGTNVEVPDPRNTWFCKRGNLLATLELCTDNVVKFCVWHEKYVAKEVVHYQLLDRFGELWPDVQFL